MKRFVALVILLGSCSCAAAWDKYPMSLYNALKAETPDSIVAHHELLADLYMSAERQNKNPPAGIAAEYAYYSWMLGQSEQAKQALDRERIAYPESAKFCDLLERFAEGITPIDVSTSNTGGKR